ncbi:MAG: glycosyltransferase [Actinomycetota bacterium]|nr:glycosyltransferase [Actinomycetota bacterium]
MTSWRSVSVVIPTRNRRSLLGRALRSVLAQQGIEQEVIVVDDGSTDGTADYVDSLADRRVALVRHEESLGVTAARNAGIAAASAHWVAFIDDDDVWAPAKLHAQLKALESTPAARWACTGAVLVDLDLRVLGPQPVPTQSDVGDLLLARNVIPGGASGVLAAADLLREVGGFDLGLSRLADWDLWIRLGLRSPCASAPQTLVAYVVHPGGMAHDVDGSQAELERIRDKYRLERSERGVDVDDAFWLWYFGQLHLRAGRRLAAARLHARLASSHRQPRRWPLVALGLVWPRLQAVRDTASGNRMPPLWHEHVEAWLGPLRSLHEEPCPPRHSP